MVDGELTARRAGQKKNAGSTSILRSPALDPSAEQLTLGEALKKYRPALHRKRRPASVWREDAKLRHGPASVPAAPILMAIFHVGLAPPGIANIAARGSGLDRGRCLTLRLRRRLKRQRRDPIGLRRGLWYPALAED